MSGYVDAVVDLMQKESFYRSTADWPAVRAAAHLATASARTTADTYPALMQALRQIGDVHGFVLIPKISDESKRGAMTGNAPPVIKRLGPIGYVRMSTYASLNAEANTAYAEDLRRRIAALEEGISPVCGWIVDLRPNGGGNMWPMLAGLGPLLGPGTLGQFVDASGARTPWSVHDDASWTGDEAATHVRAGLAVPRHPEAPLAVLLGPKTASSGEVVAISLSRRPATRSFGQPTRGLTTGNGNFPLPDGAMLFLVTVAEADRDGRLFNGPVVPDEPVSAPGEDGVDPVQVPVDATRAAAESWLAAQIKAGDCTSSTPKPQQRSTHRRLE